MSPDTKSEGFHDEKQKKVFKSCKIGMHEYPILHGGKSTAHKNEEDFFFIGKNKERNCQQG